MFCHTDLPSDCSEVFSRGERKSGIYPIKPNQSEPFYVYCQITAEEFWLGLRKMYAISRESRSILHIELEDWKQGRRFIEYLFTLEGPASHYALHLTHLSGDLPDAMTNYTGIRFSTKDNHNNKEDSTCTHNHTGGWWFNTCGGTNLNG
ncbi:hypothetical protein JZ751_014328, partial [Albula glossodonta]